MGKSEFEIERKFLIRMPELPELEKLGENSAIVQTYLKTEEGSARVRKRGTEGRWVYTHTEKKRLSDLRRIEREREVDEAEYQRLLQMADPRRRVICKDRYCVEYMGQLLEIDVFPFYTDRAFLEIELEDEGQPLHLPPWLEVIKEVTADRRYTNAALALEIPFDEI